MEYKITKNDTDILRKIAKRKMEIANNPVNLKRKELWKALHDLKPKRPMVLAEHGGIRDKKKPFEPVIECDEKWAQNVETQLKEEIWRFEFLRDDYCIEPYFSINWILNVSNYGVEPITHQVDADYMTSRRWDAPITDIKRDFHKLHPRTYSVDREETMTYKKILEDVFEEIMPVTIRRPLWWTMGTTITAINLIGLENLMLFMYDDPEGLHQLMRFLNDDHIAFVKWLKKEGLLSLNNKNEYVGSGSIGYVSALPSSNYKKDNPVSTKDMWVLLESQETVGVGSTLFEEFVFRYQEEIAKEFGLVYYGCCEPVHTRWNVISKLNNLRAVSIAPLCNQEIMADKMRNKYVFSRKPNPTLISTEKFNEELIINDIKDTFKLAEKYGLCLELIMKDVHTLSNQPERLAKWIKMAKDVIGAAEYSFPAESK
ncbi:MAG: hypothetical protein M1501_01450 [Candidatus Omnitrophica bacterium]|nr:hypothetical protein [Candidatus Omnitrophota bacterium]